MNATILWTSLSLGGLGLFTTFVAHADIGFVSVAWATMFVTLAIQAGHSLSKDTALKIAAGVMIGVGGLAGGIKVANTYFAYTGFGTIPAMLANAGTNATFTYIVGRAAAKTFLSMNALDSVEKIITTILQFLSSVGGDD